MLPPNQEPEKFDLALYHSSDSFLHLCTPGPSGETDTQFVEQPVKDNHSFSSSSLPFPSPPGLAIYFSLDHALWSGFEDYSEENDSCQDATCSPTLPQQQQPLTER